jgi:type IV pilus assembly protein PilA
MIAVAVIGILAIIVGPAYTDYTIRTKVGEALGMAGAPKIAVTEQAAQGGLDGVDGESTGFVGSQSQYVEDVWIEDGGVIVLETRNTGAQVEPVLELVPQRDAAGYLVAWTCQQRAGLPSHVPPACRGTSSDSVAARIYDLATRNPSDFLRDGIWTTGEAGFRSTYGRLYFENTGPEYDITVNATLGEGTGAGYGILFDSSLGRTASGAPDPNADTGFALQFDRAMGGLIIRERTRSGSRWESEPLSLSAVARGDGWSFRNNGTVLVPTVNGTSLNSARDPWWSQPHEITLSVRASPIDGMRTLDVRIDGQVAFSGLPFTANPNASYLGLRTWGNMPTDFSRVTVR